ncbi:holo-ACP synthase [Clostridium sp. MD294]|uniref:holo-ACP synthase n=1 Tax=Clostridium sp. MD294 TaxID=97138 RepID=UPI0002C9B0C5|nr:holo-ACP synthase [Clostridium sp. MD294]NDO47748.1 holo-[acyl-carrier-protein] synthase [Clostridium sp. MD294]USF29934.1 Holo-[acyl-carrier-protein] synthase [Clostridium sp. MD294]
MIYGIGTDIIEIQRIQKAIQKNSFLQKIFTQQEIQYFHKKGNHSETLAGIFSAKEAVAKAIGIGFRGFSPIDIEIYHNEQNKPFIKLSPKLQLILHQMDIQNEQFFVSISHCHQYATAFVLLNTL